MSYNWNCAFGLIYGEHTSDEQIQIYNEIDAARQNLSYPFMLNGDFNQIVDINERRNQTHDYLGMRLFRDWINSSSLIHVKIDGRKFTWRRGNFRSRIDRCLVDSLWLEQFPYLTLKCIDNTISNHVTLSLISSDSQSWVQNHLGVLTYGFPTPLARDLSLRNGIRWVIFLLIKS